MQLPLKVNKEYILRHQAWHTYLWPPIPWHRKAMDKEIIKAKATKFSEIFAIKSIANFVGVA